MGRAYPALAGRLCQALQHVVRDAHAEGKPVSICGEMAINHIAMTAALQDRFDFSELYNEKPALAIPFQKGNPAFKASLDKALQRVKADGRLKALAQKWLETEPVAKAQ